MNKEQEEGKTFVLDLSDGYVPVNGSLLITIYGDVARVAYRENSWDTWSPPQQTRRIS